MSAAGGSARPHRARTGQSFCSSTAKSHTAGSTAAASYGSRGPAGFLLCSRLWYPDPQLGRHGGCGKMQRWSHAFGSNPPRLCHGSCSAFLICLAAWDLCSSCPSSIQLLLANEEEIRWQEMDGHLTSVAGTCHRCPTHGCMPATGSTGDEDASDTHQLKTGLDRPAQEQILPL